MLHIPHQLLQRYNLCETLVDYALEQSDALDELGRYNLSIADDVNVPLKGVNDLYDFNEIGMRTVDNYGIVGASIDQARIAGNLDTVYGRLRNMLSPASLKYATNNLDSVDDITLGLARSLDDANDISVKGPGWSLTNEDILAAGDNLLIDFIDPSLDVNGLKRLFSSSIKLRPKACEAHAEVQIPISHYVWMVLAEGSVTTRTDFSNSS